MLSWLGIFVFVTVFFAVFICVLGILFNKVMDTEAHFHFVTIGFPAVVLGSILAYVYLKELNKLR